MDLKTKGQFELDVRAILASIGRIWAWKINSIDRSQLLQMVVEYENSKCATLAVELFNARKLDIVSSHMINQSQVLIGR